MSLNLSQQLKQTQRLVMTPQLQTSIQMLQMTTLELEGLVQQEMIENPFLEMADEESSCTLESSAVEDEKALISNSEELEAADPDNPENNPNFDENTITTLSPNSDGEISDKAADSDTSAVEEIPSLTDVADSPKFDEMDIDWDELYDDSNNIAVTSRKEDYEEHDFTDFVALRESVFENLKKQLRLSSLSGKDFEIGEYIIGNLDENGYLSTSIDDITEEFSVSAERVEKVLSIVQTFDPAGIAARNLQECLKIQLRELGVDDPLYFDLIDNHLDMLQRKKFKELAKLLDISPNRIIQAFTKISTLEPKPGRALSNEQTIYIKPDVVVRKIDGKYIYMLPDGEIANLKISQTYKDMLKSGSTFDKEGKKYAVEKFKSAVWLIKNIEKRKNTILRVTEVIMDHQREFLEKGVEYLKPLTLREVAEIVSMHESTIARVTTGKYVDTPNGIYELKYFFSSGIERESGEMESSVSIKQKIKTLIEAENTKKPLSDQKIAQMLLKEGIQIARRTVAKYREQLKILPAKFRKSS